KAYELRQRGASEATLQEILATERQLIAKRLQYSEAQKAAAAAVAAAAAQARLSKAQALTAFESQQLGYQLHDLFVQIASGQSPITALVQQGSQLSGTFGGLGGVLRAVLTLLTPVRVLLGGAAAAAAAFGLAVYQGSEQSKDLQRALALTNNAAGLTEGQ